MILRFCALSLAIGFFLSLMPAHAQQAAPLPPDVLHLTAGPAVPCRVLSSTDTAVKIEYRAGVATQTREVPWADVARIDFSMDEAFRALLAATDYAKDGVKLELRWKALAPLLPRPNHPAGDLGLVLARLSLTAASPQARQDALTVCELIRDQDWSLPRRQQARWLRVQLLTALSRGPEALSEARALAAESGVDPAVAMPATLYLAKADIAALKQLETDNPLWVEDDTVRPDREKLFHAALDGCLKPSLFHGTLEPVAPQGLWTAVQLLQHDRSLPAAADTARDLIHLYAAAAETTQAKAWLAANNLPLDPPEDEPMPVAAAEKKAEPEPPEEREPAVKRRARYDRPPAKTKP